MPKMLRAEVVGPWGVGFACETRSVAICFSAETEFANVLRIFWLVFGLRWPPVCWINGLVDCDS
jgi:hypothetical protein